MTLLIKNKQDYLRSLFSLVCPAVKKNKMKQSTKNKIRMKSLRKQTRKLTTDSSKQTKQNKIDMLKARIKTCEYDLEHLFGGSHAVTGNKIKLLKQQLDELNNG